jgi:hypothetical protein
MKMKFSYFNFNFSLIRLPIFQTILAIAKSQLLLNHFYKKLIAVNEEKRIISSYVAPHLINTSYPGVEICALYETARLVRLLSNVKPLNAKTRPGYQRRHVF